MKVIQDMTSWRSVRRTIQGTIGFVPTMGALHAGHLSLLERSAQENKITVLSIYVNPTQFNNPEDLENYPSTLDEDLAAAERVGADFVIMPTYQDMYADGFRYQVNENRDSGLLCGAHRPGHFTGVLTVVMKLLNLVRADRAYFGEKDYQQLQLVRDMADAFFLETEILGCATVRECDGLALSSRNARLDRAARAKAPTLQKLLKSSMSDRGVIEALTAKGFVVDYIESRDGRRFGAVLMDCGTHQVRLIDNVPLAGAGTQSRDNGAPSERSTPSVHAPSVQIEPEVPTDPALLVNILVEEAVA